MMQNFLLMGSRIPQTSTSLPPFSSGAFDIPPLAGQYCLCSAIIKGLTFLLWVDRMPEFYSCMHVCMYWRKQKQMQTKTALYRQQKKRTMQYSFRGALGLTNDSMVTTEIACSCPSLLNGWRQELIMMMMIMRLSKAKKPTGIHRLNDRLLITVTLRKHQRLHW